MTGGDPFEKVNIDEQRAELDGPGEYPDRVVVDIREYVDFDWQAGVRRVFDEYDLVDETGAAKAASYIAAPHLYVREHVPGYDGDDEPKPPSRTLSEGGVCYNQSIALISLYGTLSVPSRKLKIVRPGAAHSTVLVGFGNEDSLYSESEIRDGLRQFYEANDRYAPETLVVEPPTARHLSDDARSQYGWYLADPTFSKFVGDAVELRRHGYLAGVTDDGFWNDQREMYELVFLSDGTIRMLGEHGLQELKSELLEVDELMNDAIDEYRDLESSADELTRLRELLGDLKSARREYRETNEQFEAAERRDDEFEAAKLRIDLMEPRREVRSNAREIKRLLNDSSAASIERQVSDEVLAEIDELLENTLDIVNDS